MRVKFETVNGVETRYYTAGEGTPLFLVHGGGVSADSWVRNIPALGEKFRVIAMDTLGHGFTGPGSLDGGAPQPHMVQHILDLADHLGIEKFSICGSSYGAMLSMLTYLSAPERVERLVMLSSASATLSEEELSRSLEVAYKNGSSAIHDPTLESCRARMARINHSPDAVPPEVLLMQLNIYSRPQAAHNYDLVMKGLMKLDECRPYRVAERFAELKIPTLMIWGNDDKRVIMSRALNAVREIENGYLIAFRDCGHEPHMEQPDKFNRILADFLTGNDMSQFEFTEGGQVKVV